MIMRLDYALYGLAIVLFALTVVTLALAQDETIYAASTAIVGLLLVGGGYFLKPKANVRTEPSPPQQDAMAELVEQTPMSAVEAPKMDTHVTTASKTETPIENVLSDQIAPSVETQKIETPPIAEMQTVEQVLTPMAEETATKTIPATAKLEFTQIRGISEKRAEQLKANGVNTVEKLAAASADDLAIKLDVSPKIVKMWIGSAKKLLK